MKKPVRITQIKLVFRLAAVQCTRFSSYCVVSEIDTTPSIFCCPKEFILSGLSMGMMTVSNMCRFKSFSSRIYHALVELLLLSLDASPHRFTLIPICPNVALGTPYTGSISLFLPHDHISSELGNNI